MIIANTQPLQALKRIDLVEVLREALEIHKEEILKLNQRQLFEKGIDGQGRKLNRYKSGRYAKMKNQMNPLPGFGVPDLRLSGKMYRGMDMNVTRNTVDIFSRVDYAKYIEIRYGEDVYKLTNESKEEAAKIMRPTVYKLIKQQLQ